MSKFNLVINGSQFSVDVDPNTPVLWVLRDHLKLFGTKYGCGRGLCGACTIHLNGSPLRSCQLPISAVGKNVITTIEGLSKTGEHPFPPVFAAVANALYKAMGKRFYQQPFQSQIKA